MWASKSSRCQPTRRVFASSLSLSPKQQAKVLFCRHASSSSAASIKIESKKKKRFLSANDTAMDRLTFRKVSEEHSRVKFAHHGAVKILRLDNQKALNALNLKMVEEINERINTWTTEEDKSTELVLVDAEGERAFCAGGDVVTIAQILAKEKRPYGQMEWHQIPKRFFSDEYRMNHQLAVSKKPQVSFIDGIVMGGGVGLSVHGACRVATERTVFSMPEVNIGFFPDVGGSYFLPRLDGYLGMYLALTGKRLKGVDVFYAGIATHYVYHERIDSVKNYLLTLDSPTKDSTSQAIDTYMAETGKYSLMEHLDAIDRCFSAPTVREIIERLEKEKTPFADEALKAIISACPMSVAVTHKMLWKGYHMTMEECLKMEYRISQAFMQNGQFKNGVTHLLIEKKKNPEWTPASLADIDQEMVDDCFKPRRDVFKEWTKADPSLPSDMESAHTYGLISEHMIRNIVENASKTQSQSSKKTEKGSTSISSEKLLSLVAPFLYKPGNVDKLDFLISKYMNYDEVTGFLSFKENKYTSNRT
eukprot:Nk52_evm55s152 gene=Nk52_evmTU55s152